MLPESKLAKSQKKTITKIKGNEKLIIELRHDDECGNGHNTFAITADLYEKTKHGTWGWRAGGCLHDEIAQWAPAIAPFIKWHLCSTDGPMHYIANSMYHASSKDCWGRRKGEPRAWSTRIQFETSPGISFPMTFAVKEKLAKFLVEMRAKQQPLIIEEHAHKTDPETFGTHYTFAGYGNAWHLCPFRTRQEAEEMQSALARYNWEIMHVPTAWSEGKEPDLEAARSCAIWPEATLEDFIEEKLLARLPALMQEFKAAVEALGFEY